MRAQITAVMSVGPSRECAGKKVDWTGTPGMPNGTLTYKEICEWGQRNGEFGTPSECPSVCDAAAATTGGGGTTTGGSGMGNVSLSVLRARVMLPIVFLEATAWTLTTNCIKMTD